MKADSFRLPVFSVVRTDFFCFFADTEQGSAVIGFIFLVSPFQTDKGVADFMYHPCPDDDKSDGKPKHDAGDNDAEYFIGFRQIPQNDHVGAERAERIDEVEDHGNRQFGE